MHLFLGPICLVALQRACLGGCRLSVPRGRCPGRWRRATAQHPTQPASLFPSCPSGSEAKCNTGTFIPLRSSEETLLIFPKTFPHPHLMFDLCFHPAAERPPFPRFLQVSRLGFRGGTVSCWRTQPPPSQKSFAATASFHCSKALPELAGSAQEGLILPPPAPSPGMWRAIPVTLCFFQRRGSLVPDSFLESVLDI